MTTPRVLVMRSPGTNCDVETAYAFALAGGQAERVHINRLLEAPRQLDQFQILCVPGGFSYGDDLAAGRILASKCRLHLSGILADFREAGKLILGICNGFQVLIRSGILLADDASGTLATLTWNDHGRFEDRWVHLGVQGLQSIFLQGITELELPIAHAEGRFFGRSADILQRLRDNGQLVLRFIAHGAPPGDEQLAFPVNPNGSHMNVAGVCDPSGRVFGLMPHPERFVDRTQHPRWTRQSVADPGQGLEIFRNAVGYFR